MHLDAAADRDVNDAGRDEVRGEVDRLLRRAALAVDGRAGHFDREAGFEHDVAADVRGLLADLRDVAEHHVADQRRVEPTRSTTSRSTFAPSVTGCVPESMPLRRPMAVRTASTMTTSVAKTTSCLVNE